MRTTNTILLGAFCIALSVMSCKKSTLSDEKIEILAVNPAKVYKLPETKEEKEVVENLKKVTNLLKILYQDNSNVKEINAAIFSKSYSDESVLLKDLIYPKNSHLSKSSKYGELCKKWNVTPGKFAENFWREATKLNDPVFNSFLQKVKNSAANISSRTATYEDPYAATIYFPYSENYEFSDQPVSSLATATADADEGWGDKSFYDENGMLQWTRVLVNDDYAYENPTYIIGVNGIEAYEMPTETMDPPPPPPPPGVSRVYVGEALCKKQYDRFISFTGNGGGSEMKYCHLTGYLQPVNGQVTSFQDIVSVNFSRGDIRNKRLLRKFIVWDDDWVPDNLEQVFAIYEEDNTSTRTFNGSLSTTLTTGGSFTGTTTGSIGYSISVTSQDDIIRELKISRNSYFSGAYQDQGWGFSSDATFIPPPVPHGWPYYDATSDGGADVGWTWPYNTY